MSCKTKKEAGFSKTKIRLLFLSVRRSLSYLFTTVFAKPDQTEIRVHV